MKPGPYSCTVTQQPFVEHIRTVEVIRDNWSSEYGARNAESDTAAIKDVINKHLRTHVRCGAIKGPVKVRCGAKSVRFDPGKSE